MKHDERFEQRWEFRRKEEVDGDTSSDENGSNSSNDPANTNRKLVTDLILVENDDDDDDDDKVEKTKNESKKKLQRRKKKSEGRAAVNENKRRKREVDSNETMMLKDLKKFANSLIHELSVTRENMFAHMRDEMRKLSSPNSPIKTSVRRPQKNEKNEHRRANKQQKDDELVHTNNIPLLKPDFQVQRNGAHLNEHVPKISSSSEIEIGKLMAGKRFSHRITEFQPQEWFNVGLVGQSALPVPFIRGTRNGANASGLTYCDTSFADSGVRMNGRFPTF